MTTMISIERRIACVNFLLGVTRKRPISCLNSKKWRGKIVGQWRQSHPSDDLTAVDISLAFKTLGGCFICFVTIALNLLAGDYPLMFLDTLTSLVFYCCLSLEANAVVGIPFFVRMFLPLFNCSSLTLIMLDYEICLFGAVHTLISLPYEYYPFPLPRAASTIRKTSL